MRVKLKSAAEPGLTETEVRLADELLNAIDVAERDRAGRHPRCTYCGRRMRGWRARDWRHGYDVTCATCEKSMTGDRSSPGRETMTMTPQERLQLRGTCPACMGEYVVCGGVVGKHGWSEGGNRQVGRYGQAWHQGECFGVGYKPFEVSPEGTFAYCESLYRETLSLASRLHVLRTGTPELLTTVKRDGKNETVVLTVNNEAGREGVRWDTVTGTLVTRYEVELRARRDQVAGQHKSLMRTGSELLALALAWKPGTLRDTEPKREAVHFRPSGARLPWCGSRSWRVIASEERSEVTCSRCLKALACVDAESAKIRAEKADADALCALLANGMLTIAQIKKSLGWDTRRVNAAINRADHRVSIDYENRSGGANKYTLREPRA